MNQNKAPPPGHAFETDFAARLLDDALGDRQAKTRALFLARVGDIAGRKRLEQRLRHFRGDAQPVSEMAKRTTGLPAASLSRSRRISTSPRSVNLRALSASLSRAWRTRRGSAATRGRFAAAVDRQAQPLFPGARLQQPRHGAGGLHGIAILILQCVVIVAGQRDDIVEQGLKSAARLQHDLDVIGLLLGQIGPLQQLRHAQKRVHRRAQFVARYWR